MNKTKKRLAFRHGLLPLSGDPITWGHLDIVRRAAEQCEKLLVAILENPDKAGAYALKPEERIKNLELAIKLFCPGLKISVMMSDESMVDVFVSRRCDAVFRGIRDEADREYEETQLIFHEMLLPGIRSRTVFLEANPALKHVQSTVARNFAEQHLDASSLVPMFIQSRLWRMIHRQKVVGITGLPGVGKTTLIQAALPVLRDEGLPAHHVDLGKLREAVLADDCAGAAALRKEIAADAKKPLDADFWARYRALLSRAYRRELKGRSGVVLVEDSFLTEDGLCHWVNNNVVVIESDDFLPPVDFQRPFGSMFTAAEKLATAKAMAEADKSGEVFLFPHAKDDFLPGLGGVLVAKAKCGRF